MKIMLRWPRLNEMLIDRSTFSLSDVITSNSVPRALLALFQRQNLIEIDSLEQRFHYGKLEFYP